MVSYIGYKGFDKDLKCRGFQYEIGKIYEMDDKPSICERGFHFCKTIKDVFTYKKFDCRICKVEALGDIDTTEVKKDKFCTNKIKILEELDISEIKKLGYYFDLELNGDETDDQIIENLMSDYVARCRLASLGIMLDKLIDDPDWQVRRFVAKQGYGLDILVNDPDWQVRITIVRQGYGLDKLINDPDQRVRCAVANYGYGLDKLSNDPDWQVRCAVADQGYKLEKLINDKNPIVQYVAETILNKK